MAVVLAVKWVPRPSSRRRARPADPRQPPARIEERQTAAGEREEEERIGDDQRFDSEPEQRRPEDGLKERRVGVRERQRQRVEDVAVEQVRRICAELMREAREPPRREDRIPRSGTCRK